MQREIGGYFGLELLERYHFLHDNGYCVNSGRNALELILNYIPDLKKLWIPYFTCEVILEPLEKHDILYDFYAINERLEIANELKLLSGEYLLLTNYFGIKDRYIRDMVKKYGDRLIVDNSQAYFCSSIPGVKTFYSPRKFVGVPDGGIAFLSQEIDLSLYPVDCSWDRCSHLLKRLDVGANSGYADFKSNSHALVNMPIRRMSHLTQMLLRSIDYERIKMLRRENFLFLHKQLESVNRLQIDECGKDFSCPMIYPYYVIEERGIRKEMIDNRIFVATYWPNIFNWCEKDSIECQLATNIIPLPIDQRYTKRDLQYIIDIILNR